MSRTDRFIRLLKNQPLTYLRSQGYNGRVDRKDIENTDSPAQRETHEPCMVCGRVITGDPARFRPTPYQNRTIYFCTGFCLDAFLADPDRFYAAHSRRRDG